MDRPDPRATGSSEAVEQRLRAAHEAADALARRADPEAGEALAMWQRIVGDPNLRGVLEHADQHRARPWRVERGRIVLAAPEDPVPPSAGPAPPDRPPAPPGADAADDAPRTPSPGPRPAPVAPFLSRFVGRGEELANLRALLQEERLVTLTGAGGCGKSRLAVEFVRGLPPDREAVVVDLAPVTDSALVAGEVAAALGRQEGGIGAITASFQQEEVPFAQRLADGLRDRDLLLVLDNCDRVVDACAGLVRTLITTCPGLQIVCTSRVVLDLDGEHVHRLPSLALPPEGEALDPDDLRAYESVQLFLVRARTKRRDLDPSAEELGVIAEICRGLDGIPYAIELAAARVGVLSPRQILERLDDQLRWRRAGRPATPRQETMRAMIDWSYALLSPDQQVLLRRLSVFRGGFGFEAVQEVCAGPPLAADETLELLGALVDKSLLEADDRFGARRYRLLETTRRYAREQLVEAGEEADLQARHRAWCLRIAQEAAPHLNGPRQAEWLDRLAQELENLRVALQPGPEGRQDRLKLVSELAQLFFVRGQLSEGKLHFDRVLAENPEPSRDRIIALAQSAELALSEGRLDDAARAAHEALPHARRSADERSESLALRVLAVEQFRRNPSDRARELLLTSRNIARKGGRPWNVGMVDIYLGDLAEVRGRYDEARQWYETAELSLREAGNTWGHTWALRALGNFLLHQNQFDQADQRLRESLALARHLNSRQFVVLALHDLGNTAYRRDEQGLAAHWYEEAMAAMDRLDEQTTLCQCRASMAKVCVARGDLGGARRWLGSVDVNDPLLRRPARAQVRRSWGRYLAATGRVREAEREHREALGLWYQLHDHRRLIEELESLALLAEHTGRRDRAAQFHQVTATARRRLGLAAPPVYRHEIEALAAALAAGGQLVSAGAAVPSVEETVITELKLRTNG